MASVPGTDCTEVRLLLSVLADGETRPEETARAEAHVASCDACASHLAFLRLTNRALRQMPEAYPPGDLSARIAAATYDRPTLAERLSGWLRPAPVRVAVGALAAAGLAAVFILPRVGPVVPEASRGERAPAASRPVAAAVTPRSSAAGAKRATAATVAAVTGPGVGAGPSAVRRNTAAQVAAAPVRPAERSKPAPAPLAPARMPRIAPVTVAAAGHPKNAAMLARTVTAPTAEDVVRALRSDALVDRHFPAVRGMKSSAQAPRRPRGAAALVAPRSGYDRSVETLSALHGPEMASAAPVGIAPTPARAAAAAAPPQPRAVPTPYAVAEQPAPKITESEAPSAVAAAAGDVSGALRFSVRHHRASNNVVIDTGGAKEQAASRSGAPYAFNQNPSIQGSVVGAPVQ